jgi:predicted amino acid-binding ACT domain protein
MGSHVLSLLYSNASLVSNDILIGSFAFHMLCEISESNKDIFLIKKKAA